MISFRTIEVNTNESSEQVFSRLSWAVERIDKLFHYLITWLKVETDKPWVGTYNKEKMKFTLAEPKRFLNLRLFQIVVRGRIVPQGMGTVIKMEFRLGWQTLFSTTVIYLGLIGMVFITFFNGDKTDFWKLIQWIVMFLVPWTFFLIRKLNKIEGKVKKLFDIL